jgi:hypothetical protein
MLVGARVVDIKEWERREECTFEVDTIYIGPDNLMGKRFHVEGLLPAKRLGVNILLRQQR